MFCYNRHGLKYTGLMSIYPMYDEQNPLSVDAIDRHVPREFVSVPVRAGTREEGRRRQLHLLDRLEEALGERRRHGLRQRPVRDGCDSRISKTNVNNKRYDFYHDIHLFYFKLLLQCDIPMQSPGAR